MNQEEITSLLQPKFWVVQLKVDRYGEFLPQFEGKWFLSDNENEEIANLLEPGFNTKEDAENALQLIKNYHFQIVEKTNNILIQQLKKLLVAKTANARYTTCIEKLISVVRNLIPDLITFNNFSLKDQSELNLLLAEAATVVNTDFENMSVLN